MPIYEYICEACEETHDALQKMSDAPLTDCPACSEPSLKKMLSAPSFRLSGSGWYETDFKNKPKPKEKPKAKTSGGGCASGGCGCH